MNELDLIEFLKRRFMFNDYLSLDKMYKTTHIESVAKQLMIMMESKDEKV